MSTATGQTVKLDRRFDELASALELPTGTTSFSSNYDYDDSFPNSSQASNYDLSVNKFSSSPTTPTSTSPWSMVSSTSTSSSQFTSSSSSATIGPSGLYGSTAEMTPSLEDISLRSEDAPENGDRFSIITSTTSSEDRFSTVALKTPTTGSMSPPLFPAEPLPGLGEALEKASAGGHHPGPSTSITDDEEDLGTTHAGNYGNAPQKKSREFKELSIRTDLKNEKDDAQRTPIAGGRGRVAAARALIEPPLKSPMRPKSGNVTDFLLAKLNKDKLESRRSGRVSIEGREKLQEEFQRLQVEQKATEPAKGQVSVSAAVNPKKTAVRDDEKVDWDFWGLVVADYETAASEHSEKLARAIQRGIPPALRGMVWQLMSTSKDAELERSYASMLKETSPHEKAITRDLGRTFPQHSFFSDGQGVGQENLFNVLKAYSLHDPEVGYCQGLAFIGAALLLNMPDEEAFCVLVRLMSSYGSRDMYLPEMPGLQLRLFQFDRLVEELLPVLHIHFVRQGIKSSMYCSQWFLTMFSYRFPLDLVFRIFDSVFGHGIEALFGFSMILLIKNEEKLLKLHFDQILDYMKGELFDVYKLDPGEHDVTDQSGETQPEYRANDFVHDAFQVRITPFMLDNYANEWQELKRQQNAHAVEMDTLRAANRALTSQVRELETSLSALNGEHCDLLKEIVMAKIEREEIEAELVRYKLLYAEVMHDHEDSMSSHRISMSRASSRGSAQSLVSR